MTKCISKETVTTCNECGFMALNGSCNFETCPKASIEYCPTCTFMETEKDSEFYKCTWDQRKEVKSNGMG